MTCKSISVINNSFYVYFEIKLFVHNLSFYTNSLIAYFRVWWGWFKRAASWLAVLVYDGFSIMLWFIGAFSWKLVNSSGFWCKLLWSLVWGGFRSRLNCTSWNFLGYSFQPGNSSIIIFLLCKLWVRIKSNHVVLLIYIVRKTF